MNVEPTPSDPASASGNAPVSQGSVWQTYLVTIGVVVLLLSLNIWCFQRYLGISYWTWYIDKSLWVTLGPALLGFVTSELDDNPDLISPNILRYLRSWSVLLSGWFRSIAAALAPSPKDHSCWNQIDGVIAFPFFLAMMAGMLLWFLIVVPGQFFVNLVAGAPVRACLASSRRCVIEKKPGGLTELREESKDSPISESTIELSLIRKPVSATGTIAALMLAGLQRLL